MSSIHWPPGHALPGQDCVLGTIWGIRSNGQVHGHWTDQCLPKGLPGAHKWIASRKKWDKNGRLWVWATSITTMKPPGLSIQYLFPIRPHTDPQMPRIFGINQGGRSKSQFTKNSYARVDNGLWLPYDRLVPMMWDQPDGEKEQVVLDVADVDYIVQFQDNHGVLAGCANNMLWKVDPEKRVPPAGNKKEQLVFFEE